jgi:hypothetical protein
MGEGAQPGEAPELTIADCKGRKSKFENRKSKIGGDVYIAFHVCVTREFRISSFDFRISVFESLNGPGGEQGIHLLKVRFGVYADRVVGRLDHRDGHAILEEAQLIQLLCQLERGLR